MVAYEATTPLILVITFDDRDQTYILPETGGTYLRYYFHCVRTRHGRFASSGPPRSRRGCISET